MNATFECRRGYNDFQIKKSQCRKNYACPFRMSIVLCEGLYSFFTVDRGVKNLIN